MFDVVDARGFAICGENRVWHWAEGKVIGKDQVEVASDEVASPVAVRDAWADNPVCNLFSAEGLPVSPFRPDDFEMTTKPRATPWPQAARDLFRHKSIGWRAVARATRPEIGSV